MIVVDTSALIEIVLIGKHADACALALDRADSVLMSAGTMSEALIVAWGKCVDGLPEAVEQLVDKIDAEIVPVDAGFARSIARAYSRWGKGSRTNCLNWGDCHAYALAEEADCPLLFIGKDFPKTDIRSVLPLPLH